MTLLKNHLKLQSSDVNKSTNSKNSREEPVNKKRAKTMIPLPKEPKINCHGPSYRWHFYKT